MTLAIQSQILVVAVALFASCGCSSPRADEKALILERLAEVAGSGNAETVPFADSLRDASVTVDDLMTLSSVTRQRQKGLIFLIGVVAVDASASEKESAIRYLDQIRNYGDPFLSDYADAVALRIRKSLKVHSVNAELPPPK